MLSDICHGLLTLYQLFSFAQDKLVVQSVQDAEKAIDVGADGIVVSNHGTLNDFLKVYTGTMYCDRWKTTRLRDPINLCAGEYYEI